MLTQNQQQTIEFITAQFEKLNASAQPKTKFNLVDIKPLQDKAERIRQLDEEENISKKIWKDAQESEIKRIIALFQEDLPEDRTFIKIGDSECTLYICRLEFLSNGQPCIRDFHDSCVKISVEVKIKDYFDDYSQKWRKEYTNLYYRFYYDKLDLDYNTIEELCSTEAFKDTLRMKVL